MNAPCGKLEQVHLLFDGQLEGQEADAVRAHIASCAACQRELDDVMQLDGLADGLRAGEAPAAEAAKTPLAAVATSSLDGAKGPAAEVKPAPVIDLAAQRALKRPRAVRWLAAAGAMAAAALAFLIVRPANDTDPYHLGEARPLEVRLSHSGAREYRRYDVARSGDARGAQVPLETLAGMEKQGDLQGLATGYLLAGERSQAKSTLARAPQTPSVLSDEAAAALVAGDSETALAQLDEALRAQPGMTQALWNRGLALRDLGLNLSAAEAFDQVANAKEPGWSDEARLRADSLRKEQAGLVAEWLAADAAGRELVSKLALPSEAMVRQHPGLFRLYCYDAVRVAPDAASVNGLRPLAAQLDALSGGQVLTQLIARVAQADFAVRKPLAADYLKLFSRTLDAAGTTELLEKSAGAGQPDLRLGILFYLGVQQHLDEYEKLAKESGDPWFAVIAAQNRAEPLASIEPLVAEQILRGAVEQAKSAHLDYRLVQVEIALAELYANVFQRAPEALAEARIALQVARASNYQLLEQRALQAVALSARLRWSFALARAYLREAMLRHPEDCNGQVFRADNAANMDLLELRPADARADFEVAPSCGQTRLVQAVAVFAEIARSSDRRPDDEQRLAGMLNALHESGNLTPGESAMVDHIEGRMLLERSPEKGRALLEKVIAGTDAVPALDSWVQAARAFSYVALELDSARHGKFDEVLSTLEREDRAAPIVCTLGVGEDDQSSFLVVRGMNGEIIGSYDGKRTERLDRFVPKPTDAQLVALRACKEVTVLARPPLQGRSGILPPEIAWSYGGRASAPVAAAHQKRLIVSDAEPPASLGLPRLGSWAPAAEIAGETVQLRGPLATPSRVLAEMENATEIEVHAHGLVDLAFSDASLIALTPDADGAWALSAAQVKSHPLLGHPLVLLGACRAAVGAPLLHAPWSLPAAFIQAGATAVFASRDDIPDAQARPFFDAVLAGIRAGKSERIALRDARMEFRNRRDGGWVDSVLLFE